MIFDCEALSFSLRQSKFSSGDKRPKFSEPYLEIRKMGATKDLRSSLVVFPAGTEFVGTVLKGTGLQFKSKYGFAGANGFGVQNAMIDGLNEQGLSVGLFYFPGCAKYMEATPQNNAIGLAPRALSASPPICKISRLRRRRRRR